MYILVLFQRFVFMKTFTDSFSCSYMQLKASSKSNCLCPRRDNSMPGRHVRLSVEPRSSSEDVSAGSAGVWRTTELYPRRGRAVVWTEDVWRWSVPVSERRLYSTALGLWSWQRLWRLLRWTVQLQYVCPDLSVFIYLYMSTSYQQR